MKKSQSVCKRSRKDFNITLLSVDGRGITGTPQPTNLSKIATSNNRSLWQLIHNN